MTQLSQPKAITAAAFVATLSTAGRQEFAIVNGKLIDDRPQTAIVERWNGSRFVEVRLVWNGTQYAEVR